jgi:hypothetical protein
MLTAVLNEIAARTLEMQEKVEKTISSQAMS